MRAVAENVTDRCKTHDCCRDYIFKVSGERAAYRNGWRMHPSAASSVHSHAPACANTLGADTVALVAPTASDGAAEAAPFAAADECAAAVEDDNDDNDGNDDDCGSESLDDEGARRFSDDEDFDGNGTVDDEDGHANNAEDDVACSANTAANGRRCRWWLRHWARRAAAANRPWLSAAGGA